jgi:hypothetical protein
MSMQAHRCLGMLPIVRRLRIGLSTFDEHVAGLVLCTCRPMSVAAVGGMYAVGGMNVPADLVQAGAVGCQLQRESSPDQHCAGPGVFHVASFGTQATHGIGWYG